jgi:NTE family protein
MRAVEICHHSHAHLRLQEADLILRPGFRRFIDVLDFTSGRECVAAGMRAVRAEARAIEALLCPVQARPPSEAAANSVASP